MFLDAIERRNPSLIKAAFQLHQQKEILPDTYLIDMDMLLENAKQMLAVAKHQGMELYFMLKQVGRNPYIAKKLIELGYRGCVVVDFKEALLMMKHHIPIGNVGHLVQIPDALLEKVVCYQPEIITVYSIEKIRALQKICEKHDIHQDIMLRVFREGDLVYSGQTAGFALEELDELVNEVHKMSHIRINGVTAFPCVLLNETTKENEPTHNLETVLQAIACLKERGISIQQVNMPSSTSCLSIPILKKYHATHGEPGHALSGTTPIHATCDLVEKPAVVYVSEISHNFQKKAYCYGGGYYRRSHVANALVGTSLNDAVHCKVEAPEVSSIDYHFGLDQECRVGDCVVMGFRFQMFVTRSTVVLLEGIQSGKLHVAGYYDSCGHLL